jgi:hypothetical protein
MTLLYLRMAPGIRENVLLYLRMVPGICENVLLYLRMVPGIRENACPSLFADGTRNAATVNVHQQE